MVFKTIYLAFNYVDSSYDINIDLFVRFNVKVFIYNKYLFEPLVFQLFIYFTRCILMISLAVKVYH